jgi:hypothetical protein
MRTINFYGTSQLYGIAVPPKNEGIMVCEINITFQFNVNFFVYVL